MSEPERDRKLPVRAVALVLLAAYAVAFILENRKSVPLHFVFFTASVSLIWLILLSALIGALAVVLSGQLARRRRRRAG